MTGVVAVVALDNTVVPAQPAGKRTQWLERAEAACSDEEYAAFERTTLKSSACSRVLPTPVPWDDYGLAEARLASTKSKDPSTQVGAAIFDARRRLVSKGWNGFPQGVRDDPARYADRAVKLEVVLHAEVNAILFAQRDLSGCALYVWPMPPCARCAAVIVQSGIARVVAPAPSPEHVERWGYSLALMRMLFGEAGVELLEV